MIKNIEHFHAELYVEILRDFPDLIILEHGKVQVCGSRPNQNIAAGISAEIEALQRTGRQRTSKCGRGRIAVGRPKIGVGRGGYREALCLNVVLWVAGICQSTASGSA